VNTLDRQSSTVNQCTDRCTDRSGCGWWGPGSVQRMGVQHTPSRSAAQDPSTGESGGINEKSLSPVIVI
jgi:hypothetical protein